MWENLHVAFIISASSSLSRFIIKTTSWEINLIFDLLARGEKHTFTSFISLCAEQSRSAQSCAHDRTSPPFGFSIHCWHPVEMDVVLRSMVTFRPFSLFSSFEFTRELSNSIFTLNSTSGAHGFRILLVAAAFKRAQSQRCWCPTFTILSLCSGSHYGIAS